MQSHRLNPGERLTWTSRDGAHTIIVQRTDAGQIWTVTRLLCGHQHRDEHGADSRWTHETETSAMERSRLIAETLRDLGRMATA